MTRIAATSVKWCESIFLSADDTVANIVFINQVNASKPIQVYSKTPLVNKAKTLGLQYRTITMVNRIVLI